MIKIVTKQKKIKKFTKKALKTIYNYNSVRYNKSTI